MGDAPILLHDPEKRQRETKSWKSASTARLASGRSMVCEEVIVTALFLFYHQYIVTPLDGRDREPAPYYYPSPPRRRTFLCSKRCSIPVFREGRWSGKSPLWTVLLRCRSCRAACRPASTCTVSISILSSCFVFADTNERATGQCLCSLFFAFSTVLFALPFSLPSSPVPLSTLCTTFPLCAPSARIRARSPAPRPSAAASVRVRAS
ncbi:hypothetical protein DFH11DRAFT_1624601 [Phellopilus nigrolimitatus]|nr:hypothetical protein DFH11DRAFT_1624601 [Phellopilus nigrolimitatus]